MPDGMEWVTESYDNGFSFSGFLDESKVRQIAGKYSNGTDVAYEGQYKDGKMHGWGRYKSRGTVHEGMFEDGEFEGLGHATNNEKGQSYVGNFSRGKRQGEGFLASTSSDASVILKQFWRKGRVDLSVPEDSENGAGNPNVTACSLRASIEREALLKRIQLAMAKLQCDRDMSPPITKTQKLPSGCVYEGTILNSKRCGFGTWSHPEGDTYRGHWMLNKKHGWGTYVTSSTSRRYVGSWENDKMHGWGVYYFSEQEYYVGRYKADTKSGEGVFFTRQQPVRQVWAAGKLKDEGPAAADLVSVFDAVKNLILEIVERDTTQDSTDGE